jgi:hypothetical protein
MVPLDKLGVDGGGNHAEAALLAWLGLNSEGKFDEQA